ncbi:MAG: ABC transporter ATP-binding protein [Gammaproteobacteria bacterium]
MLAPLLDVADLVKHFPANHGRTVKAINGVSFHIAPGESLALVGESGSGKTTTGRCILKLLEPTAGAIRFRDRDITRISATEFRALRGQIQMVFQEPYDSLNPRMRIGHIIEEPLKLVRKMNAGQRRGRVAEVLNMVQFDAAVLAKYPHQLSAGEQQRIGIARALVTEPELVVLDEPTSALDVSVRAEILNLLADLQQRLGLAYLLISHDLTAVRRVCSRIAIMYLGKIVEEGDTEDIFQRPLHPYSRALLSSVLYPDPNQTLSRFMLAGEIPSPIDLPPGCHLYQRCPWAQDACNKTYPPLSDPQPRRRVACYQAG